MTASAFKSRVWRYYCANGRRGMPWRRTRDPYRIAVSEIMLQQTQVARVERFYPEFIAKFPSFRSLARARTPEVLRAWQGMGYNRRALALHRLAKTVSRTHNGRLPRERAALESLPGIGRATAGSITAFAWDEPAVFIETNIRRVFIHFFFPRRRKVTDAEIERYIKRTLPERHAREWYWALMDYGAMLGRTGRKAGNPNLRSAHYKRQSKFAGSNRELRGKTLRILLARRSIDLDRLSKEIGVTSRRARKIAAETVREGFAVMRGGSIVAAG